MGCNGELLQFISSSLLELQFTEIISIPILCESRNASCDKRLLSFDGTHFSSSTKFRNILSY
jgi:hypothetical protein